jgi:preprotein translocase subunit SecF
VFLAPAPHTHTAAISQLPLPVRHRAIRGFAVALCFGLLSNLFTSIFVSKTLFEAELANKKVASISI